MKKDIGVLLHNYVMPADIRSNEDFSAIFLDLGLINALGSDRYSFNETDPSHIHPDVLLYTLLDYKGEDNTISLDGMQEVALVFGLSLTNLIELIREVVAQHPEDLSYTDNSGVKNLQFIHDIDAAAVLYHYYTEHEIQRFFPEKKNSKKKEFKMNSIRSCNIMSGVYLVKSYPCCVGVYLFSSK